TRCYRDWSSDVCSSDLENGVFRTDLLEAQGIDANAVTLVVLGELGTGVDQLEGTDAHLITGLEQLVLDLLTVDIGMVGAAVVDDAVAALHLLQLGMATGDLGVVEHNHVVGGAPDGDEGRAQGNRMDLGNDVLGCTTAVVEGERDQRAMLVANAE